MDQWDGIELNSSSTLCTHFGSDIKGFFCSFEKQKHKISLPGRHNVLSTIKIWSQKEGEICYAIITDFKMYEWAAAIKRVYF